MVAAALAIWMQTGSGPAGVTTAGAARARGQRSAAPAEKGPAEPVKLAVLTAERSAPSGTPRNPFRFQPKAVPTLVAAPPVEDRRPLAPPAAPTPSGPPPPPPISLKFIALVERANGVKWAVLSDGKITMYGKDNDSIDGRYRIVKIGTESVELTYLDGRGRQVIRLTGQ